MKSLEKYIDKDYKKFNERIIKTNYEILGIKKKYLKDFVKNKKTYIKTNRKYYEEFIIEILSLNYLDNTLEKIKVIDEILKYTDNWAFIDSLVFNLKIDNDLDIYLDYLKRIAKTNKEFYLRFVVVFLMRNKLDQESLKIINKLDDKLLDLYYLDMAIAWFYQRYYKIDKELAISNLKNRSSNVKKYALQKLRDSKLIKRGELNEI